MIREGGGCEPVRANGDGDLEQRAKFRASAFDRLGRRRRVFVELRRGGRRGLRPDSRGRFGRSALAARAVGAWGFVHDPAKLLGEMALVGKTEFVGHFGEAFFGEHQGAAAHAHADLAHVIMGRAVVGGAELSLEGADGQSAGLGEVPVRNGFVEFLADETDRGTQRGIGRGAGFLFVERACDSGGADDSAFRIMDGNF